MFHLSGPMAWQHHPHGSVWWPHCCGSVVSNPQGSKQMPKTCWNWGSSPDDLWITFGAISPSSWRIVHVHSHIASSSHPVKSKMSNKLSSFCPISISFSSKRQCSCSDNPINLLSNGCLATPIVLFLEEAFSYFTIHVGWEFSNLQILVPFCLTIPSSIPLSPFASGGTKRLHEHFAQKSQMISNFIAHNSSFHKALEHNSAKFFAILTRNAFPTVSEDTFLISVTHPTRTALNVYISSMDPKPLLSFTHYPVIKLLPHV